VPLSFPRSTAAVEAVALSTRGTGRITGFWAGSPAREVGLGFSLPQDDDLCKVCKPIGGVLSEIQIGVRVLEGLAKTPARASPPRACGMCSNFTYLLV
jgi:hypothetical protein